MTIQERDVNILAYLLRYKYMNSHQIKRIFFAHQTMTNANRILRKLHEIGLIERIRYPSTPNLNLGSLLYLTEKGARFLAGQWRIDRQDLGYKRITKPLQSINHISHRMKLVDFWVKLDQELKGSRLRLRHVATEYHHERKGEHFFAKTRITSHDEALYLIPDMCFIAEDIEKGTQAVFFIEIDTGKETIMGQFQASRPGSLLHKYTTYEALMLDGGWKKKLDMNPNITGFRVLTVTNKESHMENIYRKCAAHLNYPELFFLATHAMIEHHGVLFDLPWMNIKGEKQVLLKR